MPIGRIHILSPLFAPPRKYFELMTQADMVVIDTSLRYDKRFKAVHRTAVACPHGAQHLTVPVSTPGTTRCLWSDVSVSAHGRWWHVMQSTLATLYGPTPYFNYYRHDIEPLIDSRAVGRAVTDIDLDLIVTLRRLLDIATPLSVWLDPRYVDDAGVTIHDYRHYPFYDEPNAVSVLDDLFRFGPDTMRKA